MIFNPVLKNPLSQTNPTDYFNNVLQVILSIFYIVGVIYFIWHFLMAGYHLIANDGDAKKIETAKNEMGYAITGLAIVFVTLALVKIAGAVFGITGLENLMLTWPSL